MQSYALLDGLGHGTGVSHQWLLAREREIQKHGGGYDWPNPSRVLKRDIGMNWIESSGDTVYDKSEIFRANLRNAL